MTSALCSANPLISRPMAAVICSAIDSTVNSPALTISLAVAPTNCPMGTKANAISMAQPITTPADFLPSLRSLMQP